MCSYHFISHPFGKSELLNDVMTEVTRNVGDVSLYACSSNCL